MTNELTFEQVIDRHMNIQQLASIAEAINNMKSHPMPYVMANDIVSFMDDIVKVELDKVRGDAESLQDELSKNMDGLDGSNPEHLQKAQQIQDEFTPKFDELNKRKTNVKLASIFELFVQDKWDDEVIDENDNTFLSNVLDIKYASIELAATWRNIYNELEKEGVIN